MVRLRKQIRRHQPHLHIPISTSVDNTPTFNHDIEDLRLSNLMNAKSGIPGIMASNELEEGKASPGSIFAPTYLPTSTEILTEAKARHKHQQAALLTDTSNFLQVKPRSPDWEVGLITGHRLKCVALQCLFMGSIHLVQNAIWQIINENLKQTEQQLVLPHCTWVLWLVPVLPAVVGYVGLMAFRHNLNLDNVQPIPQLVVWRIVSRGTNQEALSLTVQRCRKEMSTTPLFPYVIEVVTDEETPYLDQTDDIIKLRVPKNYKTPENSFYKARALHYACQHSPIPDEAWLVHLDEESHPTCSGIKGIASMICEEEENGQLRIGQGAILYHRELEAHPLLTLADSIRTGDDFARMHLQHRMGITIFGLHGSYIVCRNDIEKSVGFDFGFTGSVTEDAWWALKCMDSGKRARWVDGYIEEQSTQSMFDFLKQRRRWFLGLVLVSVHAPVRFTFRIGLFVSTFLWAFAPLCFLLSYLQYAVSPDAHLSFEVQSIINFAHAFYYMIYTLGLLSNIYEHGITNFLKVGVYCVLQIVLIPVFSALEAASIVYALVCPTLGFHVVKK